MKSKLFGPQLQGLCSALCFLLTLSGCSSTPDTIVSAGPASLSDTNYSLNTLPDHPGQIGLFEQSYKTAYQDALNVAKGGSSPNSSQHARQMAVDGIALTDSYCSDFFNSAGENQKWLLFSRDVTAAAGTLATGIIGLSGASGAATAAAALFTATVYNGLDTYTKNFLFGADNIESVRALTVTALAAHTKAIFPEPDNSIWTFQQAQLVIFAHQDVCKPANILALTREAIKYGNVQAFNAGAQSSGTSNDGASRQQLAKLLGLADASQLTTEIVASLYWIETDKTTFDALAAQTKNLIIKYLELPHGPYNANGEVNSAWSSADADAAKGILNGLSADTKAVIAAAIDKWKAAAKGKSDRLPAVTPLPASVGPSVDRTVIIGIAH